MLYSSFTLISTSLCEFHLNKKLIFIVLNQRLYPAALYDCLCCFEFLPVLYIFVRYWQKFLSVFWEYSNSFFGFKLCVFDWPRALYELQAFQMCTCEEPSTYFACLFKICGVYIFLFM